MKRLLQSLTLRAGAGSRYWRKVCFLLPITSQRIDLENRLALPLPFSLQRSIHDRLS
jgi:hypothetical protein